MVYREIFDRIASGRLGGVFVFRGPEQYVKDRALDALTAKIAPPGFADLNCQLLEGERANAAEIRRAAETLPFMSELRLVVVRDYPMLSASARGSGLDSAKEAETIGRLLEHFPETTCLVFFQRGETDATKPVWKLLAKSAGIVDFSELGESELIEQLTKMARRAGSAINKDAAQFMIRYCGADLTGLSREIEKACAHAGVGRAVSRGDIEAVCVEAQESRVFGFIDNLFLGRGEAAMREMRAFTLDADEIRPMLSLIARQARLMVAVKAEDRADPTQLAALLGVKPFVMEQARRQARSWPGERLREVVALCAEADLSVKQGLAEEQTAVERLVMRILTLAQAG